MTVTLREYSIRKLREPTIKNVDEDIKWICNSLGFISKRDQDKTAFKIVKSLVVSARKQGGLTSEELTKKVEPTIGSVIYHLKKLIKAGLVVKVKSTYQLKMGSLLTTIDDIQRDTESVFIGIKKIAQEIDASIGLENR